MDEHCKDSIGQCQLPRRRLLKIGCAALVAVPLMSLSGNAAAVTNATMRNALKYVDQSADPAKVCAGCLNFKPGPAPTDAGGCKIIGNDTEILPTGYCSGFVAKK
ncbi:hypothetical protein [Rhodocyclus tenuis]|uniref:High potential iron-sulfur proteins family profile domain-containing protein n=1 Tax=Rhodocyclus tenuis TaxID=1066 RepID=A0A840GD66_RHOTE|nr:hypothetical protein [Rhodocyclus tenuis]MBB4248810.1 hypothetical protein [Rhodocyclus tenuis]MBK1680766.1 hypothetical protein [Rhodocyclus tenuis]